MQGRSARQGLDRDGCNALVQAAFAAARGADKMLPEDKTTASKVLAIAWAKEPAAEAEMVSIREHNRTNPKAKVGFNKALEVARGNHTAAEAIAGKVERGNNATTTPAERALSTLQAFFVNHRIGQSKSVSFADVQKLWDKAFEAAEKAHNAKLRAPEATEGKVTR